MFGVPAAERAFWRSDCPPQAGGAPSTVWMRYGDGGALVFNGDDRQYLGGYEYSITVAPRSIRQAAPRARCWLDDHGIERGFSTY
jgi:hypothetical protein